MPFTHVVPTVAFKYGRMKMRALPLGGRYAFDITVVQAHAPYTKLGVIHAIRYMAI